MSLSHVTEFAEGDSSDFDCTLFDEDRKPTQSELLAKLAEGSTPTICVESCSKQKPTPSPEVTMASEEGVVEKENDTNEVMDCDMLSLFTIQRSALLEEEMKLAKLKQEEVTIRLEEAKVLLELRRIELERAKLELDRLRATLAERDSPAPTPPSSANPNPNCYNV
ncbi:hypothetical protein Y032_0071g506 [Ancylostoma ceylanicum]|uniref:Uncharacterized protein n=1 Tax=Ancylostoma ceylanicum TaxID=53326 RepID=A0A016TX40_9BILA|nr:hypothetical protein Y032_0071g506 [Ancylostoma ceylanicum]